MIFLLFISSGLFLGWYLGDKNAPNIFGTAIVTKMLNFRIIAIIAGVSVILGAVLQGSGGTETLIKLGKVDALGGAFTVALCTGLTVFILNRYNIPSSITQSIVGGIIGWSLFVKTGIDSTTLGVIVLTWASASILGLIMAPLLYLLLRYYIKQSRHHIIRLDYYIRMALVITGAFAAYSIGANNIPNITAVFISAIPAINIHLGVASLSSTTLIYLIGGFSIAVGIYSYGRKIAESEGKGIMELTPESAIVVILSQALILFLFSSATLSQFAHSLGFPKIPVVPVSGSQVIVGSIIGISLLKGVGEVNYTLVRKLMIGWILTPLISLTITFFSLFIVQNVFKIVVSGQITRDEATSYTTTNHGTDVINIPVTGDLTLIVIIALTLISAVALIVFLQMRKQQLKFKIQSEKRREESQYNEMSKALTDIEVKTVQLENSALSTRLQEKRNEVINFALNISEQRKFLEMLSDKIEKAVLEEESNKSKEILKGTLTLLHQKMSFSHEMEDLYVKAENVHNDFPSKINEKYPYLTEQEKRLTILLRVGFSSKEISSIMNISSKSVEISRYRLRKKLNIDNKANLTHFIKNI